MIYLAIVVNVCLLVIGQLLFKSGLDGMSLRLAPSAVVAMILNPSILLGLSLYVVATLVWFYVLKHAPLSLAYPLQSISYLLGLLASRYILHETVTWNRWVGVLIILLGVALVAYQPRPG